MRANESWLDQFRKENPDRVHDPDAERGDGSGGRVIRSATWDFDALPPLYNEVISLQKYRPADYYKARNAWVERLNVAARETSGGPGAVLHTPTAFEMTRRSTSVPDVDGLYGAYKIILDALTQSGLIEDDDPSVVATLSATHTRVSSRGEQGTRLAFAPAK